jgi:hypothetical protein
MNGSIGWMIESPSPSKPSSYSMFFLEYNFLFCFFGKVPFIDYIINLLQWLDQLLIIISSIYEQASAFILFFPFPQGRVNSKVIDGGDEYKFTNLYYTY